MNCKICDTTSEKIFKVKIMNKYDVSYFNCANCGFIQTEEPYWLNEAYKVSINLTDVGLLSRNFYFSKLTATILYYVFGKNTVCLDYAGGYGVFVRLMRDIGFDFYWQDAYTDNLFAKGFEYNPKSDKTGLITSFECFEHFINPIDEISKLLNISNNIVFSTELLPSPAPQPDKWWYYGFNHGQHISFYSLKTLNYIAKKFNLYFYSNNCNYHIMTSQKINPMLLKCLLRFSSHLFEFIIKRRMKSLINDDVSFLSKHFQTIRPEK